MHTCAGVAVNLSDQDVATFAEPLRSILLQLDNEGLIGSIACGPRSPADQARVMAQVEAGRPGWIQGTYRDNPVKQAVLAAIVGCTGWQEIEAVILKAFATPGLDLRELSQHLPGPDGLASAVDLSPSGPGPLADRAAVLVKQAVLDGAHPHSEVLTNESGHVCTHIQCWLP